MDFLAGLAISLTAQHLCGLVEWEKVVHSLADDVAKTGAKRLFSRLKPSEQEKATRVAIALFLHEWDSELEDKTPLTSSLRGYRDQVQRLIEHAAPDIVEWLKPETSEVDLSQVKRTWEELEKSEDNRNKVDPLPEGFDWTLVAQNYARAIRKHVRSDPELRAMLMVESQLQTAEAARRPAGPDPGFNLAGYREFLVKRCGAMQLAVMHSSAHSIDRQITLWSIFVPQSARESAEDIKVPVEIRRQLREEGQLGWESEAEASALRQSHKSAALCPVLDILDHERLTVLLGPPGSGKTSLLKYRALRWAKEKQGVLSLFIDLREYVRERRGIPEYFETGSVNYRLDAGQVDSHLKAGAATLFFDGLDEIFDPSMRSSVIEEISVLTSRYPQAPMVVTSRTVGYEPGRLRGAGFVHATLQNFNDAQVKDFLTQWHSIAEDDPKERTRLQERIERAMNDSPAVRELSSNPLLLTMMAILNRNQEWGGLNLLNRYTVKSCIGGSNPPSPPDYLRSQSLSSIEQGYYNSSITFPDRMRGWDIETAQIRCVKMAS